MSTIGRAGLLQDFRDFLVARPAQPTLVSSATRVEREDLALRIQQRVGIDVTTYSILNVHRIGIAVPGRDAFARLMTWDGDSTYWPNRLARATRIDNDLARIDIYLFGWQRILGVPAKPLFRLRAIRIQSEPGPGEPDNARYVLYACDGGYPIGHFVMYVRSSITVLGEMGPTQLHMAVGFNVYGRRHLARLGPARLVTAVWEHFHDRVTSNVLNRLKQLCEDEHRKIEGGR